MKKAVIIICSITLLISLTFFILNAISLYKTTNQPETDKTSSINVMLTRPTNWKKIVTKQTLPNISLSILDGSTATIPITAELYRQFFDYNDDQINNTVRHSTTDNAYMNLINKHPYLNSNTVDLIFVTEPSLEELETAKTAKVTLDITPIAKDGFVFIVNKSNPINSLTVEQIQKIYTGEITNWNQVGGKNQKIKAYQREANSGSQTAMEQRVMKGKTMKTPIKTLVPEGMGMLVDAVAEYSNSSGAIGYTYYYYINNLYKNDNIKVLKINGFSPENENLISNKYPFTTNYFAVMRKDEPLKSNARVLRDWLLTEQGQKLIELAGYCRK